MIKGRDKNGFNIKSINSQFYRQGNNNLFNSNNQLISKDENTYWRSKIGNKITMTKKNVRRKLKLKVFLQ